MYLNEFPELVLIKILKNCSLNELIKNKVVCKLWKCLIDEIIETNDELILFFETPIESDRYWTFNEEPINLNRSLSVNRFLFDSELGYFFSKKNNIKKLFIYQYKIEEDFVKALFSHINYYFGDKLEHLQIDYTNFLFESTDNFLFYKEEINLKNLKSFSAGSLFKYKNFNFKFQNIEQLKIGKLEVDNRSFEWFKNLRYFDGTISRIDPNFVFSKLEVLRLHNRLRIQIKMFPSLKKLQFMTEGYFIENIDELDFYMEEKNNQNRKDLKICLNGFEYTDEFKKKLSKNIELDYYCHLHPNYFDYINDHLSDYEFNSEWPVELSDKLIEFFSKIDVKYKKKIIINIKSIFNGDNFNEIEQFKGKVIFDSCEDIKCNPMSQSNLNLLPSFFPNIKSIFIIFPNRDLDFNFIADFKNIRDVRHQHMNIPFLVLKKIIENCNYIKSIWSGNFAILMDYLHMEFEATLYIKKEPNDRLVRIESEFDSKLSLLDYLANHLESSNRITSVERDFDFYN